MKKFQIAFVGINSLYGSTSALLLKQSPYIKCLKLFDPRDVESGLDVATINTQCKVKTFQGHEQLENAFLQADIIVISDESNETADTEARLMNVSANLTKYAKAISRASPDAIIVVASPPVNCLLPIMSQLLAKAGCYNHNKIVGSTSVDTMRASALLARQLNMDPKEVVLPVIGGSSEFTRVPVFSQSRPHFSLKKELKNSLIMDIRRGDSLVLANKGSPEALNRAYSTVRFLNSIMAGLRGEPNVTEITLCRTDLVPGVEYFSLPVMFGREGIIKRFGVPNTTATEDQMVEEAVKYVKKDIDKADYIVKGSIELPEHKHLSPNDRASSQKEMFDLFVKCLPKPQDQGTSAENSPKKATDYSFKSLIKEGPTADPFEAFDKKSPRHTLATKLKNVSADSFLKSTGCYTSPLQKPILILEPLGCPSRPPKTEEDELEEFLEKENILHENNLARFREKEMLGAGNRSRSNNPLQTKNQPFLSTEIVQRKTVDPIANFKEQVAKFHEFGKRDRKPKVDANQVDARNPTRGVMEMEEFEDHELNHTTKSANEGPKKNIRPADDNQPRTSTSRREEIREDLFTVPKGEVHFSSPSGRCMKKKYGSSKKSDSYVFDIKTNRIIPPYNLYKKSNRGKVDYVPEEENGKSYIPNCENEESLYNHGRIDGVENDEKYNKLVSRLFKKLKGLNTGSFFPLKATAHERANAPKCNTSFTESAVRGRSPSSAALKVRKKHKKSIDAMESESNDGSFHEIITPKKKSRHSEEHARQVMRSQFKDTEDVQTHEHQEAKPYEPEVQFVCPKCQIKVTCQPEKAVKEAKPQTPERVASDIPQHDYKKPKRNVIMKSYKVRDSQCSAQNEVFTIKNQYEGDIQDERLKKLKEKINKKLIPMMRQSSSEPAISKDDQGIPRENADTKSKACENQAFPLVLNKKSGLGVKHDEAPQSRSSNSSNWQGVPFIVKHNEKKADNYDGKNRAVYMKVVVPPAYKETPKGDEKIVKSQDKKASDDVEDEADNTIKIQAEGRKAADSNGKTGKRAAKILNKLQLLELEGIRKINIEETKNETQNKIESDKFHKERLKREINLKTDEVRNYMMTRQRGNRNVLITESSKKNIEEKPSSIFEKIDFDHLKSETMKEVVPETSESKPVIQDSEKSQMTCDASTHGKNVVSNKEVENTNPTNGSRTKSGVRRLAALARSQEMRDDGARKDVSGTETKAEKFTAQESAWSMTSPSKNFENIEEPAMSPSNGDKTIETIESSKDQINHEIQTFADKKTAQKADGHIKPSSEPSVKTFHRTPNKLQLLAKVRNSRQSDPSAFKLKVQRELRNVWEKVLSDKPVQTKFEFPKVPRSPRHAGTTFEKLDKKSAAVKMAKKSDFAAPRKQNLYRTKGLPNNVAILDGLTFPTRRKRQPTNNLLKELASLRKCREVKSLKPKSNLKSVVRRVPVKTVTHVRLSKPERYGGMKPGTSMEPESSEYTQDEIQMAKLASEILKRKTLRSAVEFKSRILNNTRKTEKVARVQKQQLPAPFVTVDHPRSSLLELQTKDRKAKADGKSSDVANKLMSMPHVRHQVENFELPLGPLEVQPGLAQFNYAKVGNFSPRQTESSWESAVFNEYSRSNALPSLRDTRETFYLEEHPS